MQDDLLPPSRNVIWNEEIEKLQIKDEELQKVSVEEKKGYMKDGHILSVVFDLITGFPQAHGTIPTKFPCMENHGI